MPCAKLLYEGFRGRLKHSTHGLVTGRRLLVSIVREPVLERSRICVADKLPNVLLVNRLICMLCTGLHVIRNGAASTLSCA